MSKQSVQTLITSGLTIGQVARKHKVKKADIQAQLSGATALTSHYSAVVPKEVEVVEAPASNSVDAMLAAAQAQGEASQAAGKRASVTTKKVQRSSAFDENGNARQRRNYEVKERNVVVFIHEDTKQAFVSTNLAFATKTEAGAIAHLKRATQKSLADFIKLDFTMVREAADVNVGDDLKAAQAQVHQKYIDAGYTVLSKMPKVAA